MAPRLNIVMIVRDRPRLTSQALVSLQCDTTVPYTMVTVDDASELDSTRAILQGWHEAMHDRSVLVTHPEARGVGASKNDGVEASARVFGRGSYLYLTDNDVYFTKGWDTVLTEAMRLFPQFAIIGGYSHPYNQPTEETETFAGGRYRVRRVDALSGVSWMMRWETWDKYGPLVANAVGSGQSEDVEFCQRITKDGGCFGYVDPWVVWHTGRTNTEGKPIVGADIACPLREGVLIE